MKITYVDGEKVIEWNWLDRFHIWVWGKITKIVLTPEEMFGVLAEIKKESQR